MLLSIKNVRRENSNIFFVFYISLIFSLWLSRRENCQNLYKNQRLSSLNLNTLQ